MHWSVIVDVPANWLMNQRPASWSYMTTGSPEPLLWQRPPKPAQMVEMPSGPRTEAPVVLLKTWKPSLTIWTYWVAPTSPFVSGGAQLQTTPGKGMPSKLRVVAGIAGDASVDWIGAGALVEPDVLRPPPSSSSSSSRGIPRTGWGLI